MREFWVASAARCDDPAKTPEPEPSVAETLMFELLDQELCDDDEASAASETDSFPDFHECDVDDVFAAASDPENLGCKSKSVEKFPHEKQGVDVVVHECAHLSLVQQNKSASVLCKHDELFDSTLQKHSHEKIHLEVDLSAPPEASGACDVSRHRCDIFKKELDHLVSIGVLEPAGAAE